MKNKQQSAELLEISAVGKRLRHERERLGLNQLIFGKIGGVTRESQVNYERGKRSPNSSYWTSIAILGIDIQYIFTGVPSINIQDVVIHLMKIKEATEINTLILHEKFSDILPIIHQLAEKPNEFIDELSHYLENKK